jgi:hypothetical protein
MRAVEMSFEHKEFSGSGSGAYASHLHAAPEYHPSPRGQNRCRTSKTDAELACRDAVNRLPGIVENKQIVLVFARYARLLRLCMLLIGGWAGGDHDGAELGLLKCSLR